MKDSPIDQYLGHLEHHDAAEVRLIHALLTHAGFEISSMICGDNVYGHVLSVYVQIPHALFRRGDPYGWALEVLQDKFDYRVNGQDGFNITYSHVYRSMDGDPLPFTLYWQFWEGPP